MSFVKLLVRSTEAFIAWALACAASIFVAVTVSRRHGAASVLVAELLLSLVVGAVAGNTFWRIGRRRPIAGALALAALLCLTAVAALMATWFART